MLKSLRIRNFAVIESLELELGAGLSVFTGETGAGKSIVIEALGFLLGERGSPDWLRAGADALEVAGVFDASDFPAPGPEGIPAGGTVVLRRLLDRAGRSRAFMGERPVTARFLAERGDGLVDFHGQNEHQSLLQPARQRELLDSFGGHCGALEKTGAAFRRWEGLRRELAGLEMSEEERLRRVDLLRFQLGEIGEVDPRPGEEEELAAQLPLLRNAERLRALAAEAYGALYEADGSAEESLRRAELSLEAIAGMDPAAAEPLAALGRARAEVEAACSALGRYREEDDSGPERLERLIARQEKLARLKRKYGAGLGEVLEFRDRAREELDSLENHEAKTARISAERARAESALAAACEELHALRRKAAVRLGEKVRAQLADLALESARFSIAVELEEGDYAQTGGDRVEFLLAANPGEALKPLRQTASGGELARVMLALKTVLARADRAALLVFDEVDTGVGAAVGTAVGRKLAELGRSRQVLAVTHLPQVACFARSHLHVVKALAGGRAFARVEPLDGDGRLKTIAAMLGGTKPTPASLRHAKELLESL